MSSFEMRSHNQLKSTSALYRLLGEVVEKPETFVDNKALVDSLTSQSKLSHYVDTDRGITACSLNTFKANSESCIEGGFASMDRRRKKCREALLLVMAKETGSTKPTKRDLGNQIDTLKRHVSELQQDLFLLQRAFDLRSLQARKYAEASKDAATIALCRKEQSEIEASFSLRNRPAPDTKVTPIR